jgi:hypothetical protein
MAKKKVTKFGVDELVKFFNDNGIYAYSNGDGKSVILPHYLLASFSLELPEYSENIVIYNSRRLKLK